MRMRRIWPGSAHSAAKIVNVADAVDLRRLRRHARLPQQLGFRRRPFEQHIHVLADHLRVPCARDAALDRHQTALAIVNRARVHLIVELVARAGVFVGIGEHAQAVELRRLHKIAQRLEIGVGFAGKADDHAGADGDARNGVADALEQLQEKIAVRAALHALQNRGAGVLQRHVDILDQRLVLGDRVQQLLRDAVRIAIQKPHPFFVRRLNLRQPRHQLRQTVLQAQILAV